MTEGDTLFDRIRRCTLCSDILPLEPRPIFEPGANAPIMIVGQAPGRLAHERGTPFDDPSGDRLRAWLGVSRDIFYDPRCFAMVPMAFCFPGTAASGRGDNPPPKRCAENWRTALLDSIGPPKLTVMVGAYAQAWHLGARRSKSLTETVRRYRDFMPSAMPLPHPSPRNNIWLAKNPWFERETIPVLQSRVSDLLGG